MSTSSKTSSFLKLSPARQRVAIAKDVLARLDARQYRPKPGTWVDVPKSHLAKAPKEYSLQVYVAEKNPCRVCAVGGIIASYAFFANEIKLDGGPAHNGTDDRWSGIGFHEAEKQITKSFGNSFLAEIERVFEGEQCALGGGDIDRWDVLDAFAKRHRSTRARFRAIFTNIVENKGEFVP